MRDRFDGSGADLSEVRRQLRAWRDVHGGRGRRLPDGVWDAAVRLAREGDPGAVARGLRLNAESLSRRMAAGGDAGPAARPRRPAFVEVAPVAEPALGGGCRVDLSGADGVRISIHFADVRRVDLAALAGGLMRAGR